MADNISELERDLGYRIRQLRLSRNLDQRTTAERAGISLRALGMLENGRGSNLETVLRALRALGYEKRIELLAPEPTVNPLALLETPKPRQRVRHSRRTGIQKIDSPEISPPQAASTQDGSTEARSIEAGSAKYVR